MIRVACVIVLLLILIKLIELKSLFIIILIFLLITKVLMNRKVSWFLKMIGFVAASALGVSLVGNIQKYDATDLERGLEWNADLFKDSSVLYNNDLAYIAAEMSEAVESTTFKGKAGEAEDMKVPVLGELYEKYGIDRFVPYGYDEGGGAFVIGHDVLTVDGIDTVILIVVARGTTTPAETIGDVMHGGDVAFIEGRYIYKNIYDFEEKIWKKLEDYIKKYISSADDIKILVTGHSLGGAAANAVGARLTKDAHALHMECGKNDIYVYTFGAIKVLTQKRNYKNGFENIHNIYNYYDSFGPNGALKKYNVGSIHAKYGHTDLYQPESPEEDESVMNPKSHLMRNYRMYLKALEEHAAVFEDIKWCMDGMEY